ncbi:amidohydrolase family protein [Eggerthella sp. YY7918]|uniref:amidohydrolase family protein n=1 Tax=Eggerthella sp. (strain YY7918) TaxID=502558 RepID=UPI00021718D2|nr:amidohydrolase family protein [Eggerthella sp. YY7918]BAK45133.1 imidazolonepropionase [Eggerthella sp. YY7918]
MTAYVFTHATVLDGTEGMEPQPNMTVVVNEGRIEAVGPAATTVGPVGAHEVDLGGAYLMPGLINAHVHLCGTGKPMSAGGAGDLIDKVTSNPIGMWYLRRMLKKSAQQQLASGVTTVRSVGDPGFADVDVRDAINAGKYSGPRLLTSGVGVTVPDGHGAGLFAHIAKTPEEARDIVRACFVRKCNLVKLFITGGVFDAEVEGEPGVLRMSPEIAHAAVDEAHKLDMSTAAHIESTEGVRVGLEAGVDTIEHGAPLDDELIALFKKNGVGRASSLTCTVSPALPFVELAPEKTKSTHVQQVNGRVVYEGIVTAAKQALEAGIPVGLGTDSSCPYITQYDMWREVVYFERIVGVTPAFALHTATLGNARILGLGDETGSIEAGKTADLIVTNANPLENLEALRQVRMVMARGVLNERPQVKHMPELDAELDGFLPKTSV